MSSDSAGLTLANRGDPTPGPPACIEFNDVRPDKDAARHPLQSGSPGYPRAQVDVSLRRAPYNFLYECFEHIERYEKGRNTEHRSEQVSLLRQRPTQHLIGNPGASAAQHFGISHKDEYSVATRFSAARFSI